MAAMLDTVPNEPTSWCSIELASNVTQSAANMISMRATIRSTLEDLPSLPESGDGDIKCLEGKTVALALAAIGVACATCAIQYAALLHCDAPRAILHAAAEGTCKEGLRIRSGHDCTPRCANGFNSESSLRCERGTLTPSTFTCSPLPCKAPLNVYESLENACEQGKVIASGSHCIAQCRQGFNASVASLSCREGKLNPMSFTCDPPLRPTPQVTQAPTTTQTDLTAAPIDPTPAPTNQTPATTGLATKDPTPAPTGPTSALTDSPSAPTGLIANKSDTSANRSDAGISRSSTSVNRFDTSAGRSNSSTNRSDTSANASDASSKKHNTSASGSAAGANTSSVKLSGLDTIADANTNATANTESMSNGSTNLTS